MESVGGLTGIAVKVGLGAVLALVATAAARHLYLARNGWRPSFGWRPGRGALRVAETAALGQNRALHLVAVGKRTLFIASTPSQVVLLADVTDEEQPGEGRLPKPRHAGEARPTSPPGSETPRVDRRSKLDWRFSSVLRQVLARAGHKPAPDGQLEDLLAAAAALRANGCASGR